AKDEEKITHWIKSIVFSTFPLGNLLF
ncbi:unnamed protein product, partial [Oikopleura dioica]